MCECLGCTGCEQSGTCQAGKCNWPVGKYWDQKRAKRCHWCFVHSDADTTGVPVVVAADTTGVPVVVAHADTSHASPVVVATTEVTTWAPKVTSARPSHTWSTPLTVRLLTDSVGRLKSQAKDYIHEVQTRVASQGNKIILKDHFTGGYAGSSCLR